MRYGAIVTSVQREFRMSCYDAFLLPVGPQKTIACLGYGEALPMYES